MANSNITVTILLIIIGSLHSLPTYTITRKSLNQPVFISREEWGAKPPTSVIQLKTPVPMVVIHHSFKPAACQDFTECSAAMRSMQHYHQESLKWSDIGYNFAVGGDGAIYGGRGWKTVGAHAKGYNSKSIGIVFIGDFIATVPPKRQIDAAKAFIAHGVASGLVSKQYKLVGHRQLTATTCPGDALFKEIQSWDNFDTNIRLYSRQRVR